MLSVVLYVREMQTDVFNVYFGYYKFLARFGVWAWHIVINHHFYCLTFDNFRHLLPTLESNDLEKEAISMTLVLTALISMRMIVSEYLYVLQERR